jgi:hypothetical protein
MAKAADAVEIDTTGLDLDDVIGEILRLADGTRPGGQPARTPPLSRKAGAWTS